MAWFDNPALYPDGFSDRPPDAVLLYTYAAFTLALAALGFDGIALSVSQELLAALTVAALLISIAYSHRRRMHWHRPNVRPKDRRAAFLSTIPLALLVILPIPAFPLPDPRFLPFYLFYTGLLAYRLLFLLRVIPPSKSAFLKQCGVSVSRDEQASPGTQFDPDAPFETKASTAVRLIFRSILLSTYALCVARLDLVALIHRYASPQPTLTQPDPVNSGGHLVYIAHYQSFLVEHLPRVSFGLFNSIFLVGFLLHTFWGVNLLGAMPTPQLRRQRRQAEMTLNLSSRTPARIP